MPLGLLTQGQGLLLFRTTLHFVSLLYSQKAREVMNATPSSSTILKLRYLEASTRPGKGRAGESQAEVKHSVVNTRLGAGLIGGMRRTQQQQQEHTARRLVSLLAVWSPTGPGRAGGNEVWTYVATEYSPSLRSLQEWRRRAKVRFALAVGEARQDLPPPAQAGARERSRRGAQQDGTSRTAHLTNRGRSSRMAGRYIMAPAGR